MNSISAYCPCLPAFEIPYISNSNTDKIKKIVTSALAEISVALLLNYTVTTTFGYFMLPASAHFMTALCAAVAVGGLALLITKVASRYFPCQNYNAAILNLSTSLDGITKSLARLSIINTVSLRLSHLIHEIGHAGAALLCFLQADPEIIVKWYEGVTTYNISYGLTKFGEFLGEHCSMLFITAAGLVTPVIFAMGEFTAAHFLKEHHPMISEMLNCHGVSQILSLALYGIQAFDTPMTMLKHDFVRLWVLGDIHPAIPIALIVVVPLCYYIFLRTHQKIA